MAEIIDIDTMTALLVAARASYDEQTPEEFYRTILDFDGVEGEIFIPLVEHLMLRIATTGTAYAPMLSALATAFDAGFRIGRYHGENQGMPS